MADKRGPNTKSTRQRARAKNRGQRTVVATGTTVRRWVRRADPASWWPWGLLPLVGLLLLAVVGVAQCAPNDIEAQVAANVKQQLHDAGYPWANVVADGQEVVVKGTPYEPVSEALIESVARASLGDTMLGELVCPTEVRVALSTPQKPLPGKPRSATVKPVKPPPAARHHNFRFDATADTVTLTGEVPSEAVKRAVEAEAKKKFTTVTNQLRVSNATAMAGYPLAYRRALAVLDTLDSGFASWSAGVLNVEGIIAKEQQAPTRALFNASAKAPKLGTIKLLVKEELDQCDKEFADVLTRSTILFATGSAKIKPQSQVVLKALADIAKHCPGTLVVEGHTDNVGDAKANRVLSLNRANAVKAALEALQLAGSRLETAGYGADRPVGSNNTAAGRAKNRRIEVRIKRH